MDVLSKNVPVLDPDDIDGSIKQIYDYLFTTMEQIDYTLSRQGIKLGQVNIAGTQSSIDTLAGQVSAISSGLSTVSGTVTVLAERLFTAESDVKANATAIAKNAEAISLLEARVKALEEAATEEEQPPEA